MSDVFHDSVEFEEVGSPVSKRFRIEQDFVVDDFDEATCGYEIQGLVKSPTRKNPSEDEGETEGASSSSWIVGAGGMLKVEESIRELREQQLRSTQLIMEMARTASQIAFLKQGKIMAEGVCASSLRQDEFGIFQKQSLILQDKMKKRYERQKAEQDKFGQILSEIVEEYNSDSTSIRNLHDAYCTNITILKSEDGFGSHKLDSCQNMEELIYSHQSRVGKQIVQLERSLEIILASADDLVEAENLKLLLFARLDTMNAYAADWALFSGRDVKEIPPPFSLRIIEQPISFVLPPHDRQKKPVLEGPFKLQFFGGPSQNYEIMGEGVSAVVLYEEKGHTDFIPVDVVSATEPLVGSSECPWLVSIFPRLRVDLMGKKQFCVMFYVTVKRFYGPTMTEFEVLKISITSNVFSNIVHQDQWFLEAGRLLLRNSFEGNQESISWNGFCNRLQIHFLKESRQNLGVREGRRELSLRDFNYLERFRSPRGEMQLSTFWGAPRNQGPGSASFWSHFGSILCSLRFKKNVLQMWCKGLIVGFCHKQEAEIMLSYGNGRYAPVGSFLIRFSERNPGLFACVFVANPQSKMMKSESGEQSCSMNLCKHIVVEDSYLNQSTSLADYVVQHEDLEDIVSIDRDYKLSLDKASEVLQQYLVKRKHQAVRGESYVNLRR
eukprot:TRINITY_DN3820_c0_g2_i13.p1 TRINITY_DN3820_c0_g2~~TRINITY_DN3820_c0_g2_i13.p1  ORF type:complete len:665 (+),score=107.95 TRINITY_DN3820_c0_g2_i13:85-2079(+)